MTVHPWYESYLEVHHDPDRVSCFHNHETFHFVVRELWPHCNDKIRAGGFFRISVECSWISNSHALYVSCSLMKHIQ